jgi:hypothetical protein
VVRCTFSPARAWRPAVGARLARTLGITGTLGVLWPSIKTSTSQSCPQDSSGKIFEVQKWCPSNKSFVRYSTPSCDLTYPAGFQLLAPIGRSQLIVQKLLLLFAITVAPLSLAATPSPASGTKLPTTTENSNANEPRREQSNQVRGTQTAPIFVQTLPNAQSPAELAHKEYEHSEKPALDRGLVYGTYALAIFTFALAIFTALMWGATYRLAKHARTTGDDQSAKMANSIAEASRAAAAQEGIAQATKENAELMQGVLHKQMRAYLIVEIGGGIYQDFNKRFEVRPSLLNSGFTPAIDMSYWALAGILPFPLANDHNLPVNHSPPPNSMDLGPRQSIQMNAAVDTRVPDSEVAEIKSGLDRRVYVWGAVTYKDIFGGSHTTDFCHSIFWYGTEAEPQLAGTYDFNKNKLS